ncbi:MAG: hypothetical protein STSR0002_16080 [Smithella sp.]
MTRRITTKITYTENVCGSDCMCRVDACPAHETVLQFIFMSFRCEARNLVFNKFRALRFLTYVRNDSSHYRDTVSNTGGIFQQPRGFTLVEILIAIFILGLVMSTVYVSYSGILKTSHQMEEENNIYRMARTSMDRMIKDLSSLQTNSGSLDFRAEKKTLSNREFYSLSFWSASHLAFGENEGTGRPATISYYVQEDEGGESFSLWRSDIAGTKPDKEKNLSGGFMICQNIDSWKLRFYDFTGKELESWDSSSLNEQKDKAPVAVKIELALVNVNDKEKPYKFMTKVFLPVKQ